MKFAMAAALALVGTSVAAQTVPDFSTASPVSGTWRYASTGDGSEATFVNDIGGMQLWVHCTRATRRVSVAKPASVAAPFLNFWTSSLTRNVASSFNPATARLTVDLASYDPLLDAIASSRGRFAVSVGTQPALVVPPWAEASRVIEDCRA
ncbi:MAG: hypothetical protein HOP91_07440 [Sphingomonas sp.]|nr:hypothetical protein [Sphingomonas sp.]